MSEADFVARFGKDKLKAFQDKKKSGEPADGGDGATNYKDHLARCYVWEIWSKERKTVDWFVEGYPETLDHKDDPLGLENFWPFPRPMVANLTTSKFLPTPTSCWRRISTTESIRWRAGSICWRTRSGSRASTTRPTTGQAAARGEGPQRSLSGRCLGGVRGEGRDQGRGRLAPAGPDRRSVGQAARVPDGEDRAALSGHRHVRHHARAGQPADDRHRAGDQGALRLVRVQSMQDEFARFCSDVQKIKAEIISKHFEPQTIIERSNVMRTPDAQLAGRPWS
jgi:hypothetical protein